VLALAIGSVLRQTFRDFELLVIGDCCTDDSESVVAAIGDPRVRWINLAENSGHQSAPNNEGLRQARGEFIAYLGHDDLWLPHHLAAHVEALERTGSGLAYSLCMLVAADGTSWPSVPRASAGSFSPPSCMTHRRAVTDDTGGWRDYRTLNEAIDGAPDCELWRRAQRAGKTFVFVPRLTGIKFPAAWRRDVYRNGGCHEQEQWLARIDAEPDLEATLLATSIAVDHVPDAIPFRELLRHAMRQAASRIRRRLSLPSFFLPSRRTIDANRRFKGLR
jgi:glycosyltransferase involved in cell wall biosynthesis